eukprot:GEMP01003607.1.p1 GENE.GEMP01003607.1~~GEMP01003607.1.p1  ORF type:complete len:579 (+),score=121.24 GEMP01003607.1:215-1951(+)
MGIGKSALRRLLLRSSDRFEKFEGRGIARAPHPSNVPSSMRVVYAPVERDWVLTRRTLGTGFSGAVILATHRTKPGLRAAVKTFSKKHKKRNATRLAMLRNEIEVYLRLDHPNICRLLWTYESKDTVWLVMELCSEELYDKLCKRKVFSEDDTASIIAQMLRAINYLHAHQIVHRDLKLENWMFQRRYDCWSVVLDAAETQGYSPKNVRNSEELLRGATCPSGAQPGSVGDERIKLIDFGFSQMLGDPSQSLDVPCGTLHYASPDVLKRNYNAKCDIWSLGVICYMLLTGSPPFSGSRNSVVLEKIKNGRVRFGTRWHALSREARAFVLQCLTVDPENRMDAKQALRHSFLSAFVYRSTPSSCISQEVVDNLNAFAMSSKLMRALWTMLAYALTSNEMLDFHEIFLSFDLENSGTLKYEELEVICKSHRSLRWDEAELRNAFSVIAVDSEIHYTPFLAAMIAQNHLGLDKVQQVFTLFDPSRDGYISVDDLVSVFSSISLTQQESAEWVREHDVKGNGMLDYEAVLFALNFLTLRDVVPEDVFEEGAISENQVVVDMSHVQNIEKVLDEPMVQENAAC